MKLLARSPGRQAGRPSGPAEPGSTVTVPATAPQRTGQAQSAAPAIIELAGVEKVYHRAGGRGSGSPR